MSILYSLAGGILSFSVMILLIRIKGFSIIGVSIGGGIFHNAGQLLVASFVVQNLKIFYYFPALFIAGTLTGAMIGIVSARVLKAVKKIGTDAVTGS